MGATFENLSMDELCDLMCGQPEKDCMADSDYPCDGNCEKCQYYDELPPN